MRLCFFLEFTNSTDTQEGIPKTLKYERTMVEERKMETKEKKMTEGVIIENIKKESRNLP